jgi:hypothetical protein
MSNDLLLHSRLMRICEDDLLVKNLIKYPRYTSHDFLFLQMSAINISQLEQQWKNQFNRRLLSIGDAGMHRYHNMPSTIGTNMMRQANGTLTASNFNPGSKVSKVGFVLPITQNHLASVEYLHNTKSGTAPSPKLPFCLAQPADKYKLSEHQNFLRFQIEAFQASDHDVNTHIRGRNKPIVVGQVGIRCRHCAHLPVSRRQKGSVYFPANTMGLYQAAQNMSTTHIQCGLCTEMPEYVKEHFKGLIAKKAFTSGAGSPYWDKSAREMGLVNTDDGIRFYRDIPSGTPSGINDNSQN